MNRDTIIERVNELREWKVKAIDLVNYNDYIKGYNEAVNFEIEFLLKILAQLKT